MTGSLLNASFAQNCDIAQSGLKVYDAGNTTSITTIPRGQTANFRFSIKNTATAGCSIPAGSVTAVFDFPTLSGNIKPYVYSGPTSFTSGYFTWNYDAAAEVLIGTNNQAIPGGEGDIDVIVKVKGNAAGTGNSNLNLSQGKGVSDNMVNNFNVARLSVSATGSHPVNLTGFNASVDLCDVTMNWKTTSENNFSHFEIEFSEDGIIFKSIGRMNGTNSVTGGEYQLIHAQLVADGYYRLKEVAQDNSIEYSNTLHVATTCRGKGKIVVHPNPLNYSQKLKVSISGYTGKMIGELFSSTGQKVASYTLANRTNELSVENLSAGSYMLKIRNENGEVNSFKVVVTR